MAVAVPHPRFVAMATGDLSDADHAIDVLDNDLPQTAQVAPQMIVLDLRGKLLSAISLRRIILTMGQRVRGGIFGEAALIVLTSHEDVRDSINDLAASHELPVYVSYSFEDPGSARMSAFPAGDLTSGERETLDRLRYVGGSVTVAGLAGFLGIESTAANNRLVNVERKNYVYRIKRGRRDGDLFLDPRAAFGDLVPLGYPGALPKRSTLLSSGITADPYDSSAVAEGEAAEFATEILRRRGKIT